MSARFIVGDVFDVLATLEPGSVDLVVTSPPFLALRSYLPADHEHKSLEIGSEATPGAFIDRMLDVVEACARVLAPHGSLVFELGDTYAGSGGAGGDYSDEGLRAEQPRFDGSAARLRTRTRTDGGQYANHQAAGTKYNEAVDRPIKGSRGWPLDKSKVLIPQLFAISLAYGFNPLTGRPTEPWRVRNTVAWCRPNPPVGRDGDKFRPATSTLTIACKARDRYWDGDAVRVSPAEASQFTAQYRDERKPDMAGGVIANGEHRFAERTASNPAGAPLLDYWVIPTAPYKGSHYATYPPDLVVPLVKAMCPRRVCRACGEPSRRITADNADLADVKERLRGKWQSGGLERGNKRPKGADREDVSGHQVTLGWSDCGCPGGEERWRTGLVLDPFAGSGTTLAVASGHGLDSIGIDLDERNAWLARERIGMFCDIETPEARAFAEAPVVTQEN